MLLSNTDEQGAGMSVPQVRDELITLLAAGHETTVNALAWTFYLLSEHPGVLDRVLTKLQTQLAGRDLHMEDLPRLAYLDWVVKESMRLYPSGWTQGRHAREAFDLDGYHFPAGTLLMFSQWVLHRLPDVWGDPEIFRPERWDPARGAGQSLGLLSLWCRHTHPPGRFPGRARRAASHRDGASALHSQGAAWPPDRAGAAHHAARQAWSSGATRSRSPGNFGIGRAEHRCLTKPAVSVRVIAVTTIEQTK